MKLNKYSLVFLSAAGGILSGLAWSSWCSGLILLVSLVPFLIIEDHICSNRRRYSENALPLFLLPGFVLFSLLVMGWMRIASLTGAVLVILGLAILMTLVVWTFHIVKLKKGNITGYISLVSLWLTYEYISLNISIVSPWMNLGNGLAKDILFIQWYELTGTGGGSLWILISNILITKYIVSGINGEKTGRRYLLVWIPVVLLPVIFSLTRYHTIRTSGSEPYEVLVIQPNTDPYTEKFTVPFDLQLKHAINMALAEVTDSTVWIIMPETTVDDPVDLDSTADNKYIKMLRTITSRYPGTSIVAGMVSVRIFRNQETAPSISAVQAGNSGTWLDHFNSAFKIDTGKTTEVYHKSKLVPGIEMKFVNGPGKLLGRILPYLGGTRWGYGTQKERSCFIHSIRMQKVAPVICYESVFGSFVSEYVRNGAEALFIITNDGWWKNTDGYRQHLCFASIRAIETRRPVARSANTGISALIDIKGRKVSETGWWCEAALRGKIIPERRMTPYVKYGDYLLKMAVFTSTMILLYVFLISPFRRKNSFIDKKDATL